jgi:hypothetical protein
MNFTKRIQRRAALGVVLAAVVSGATLMQQHVATADSAGPLALPAPIINGAAALPGPVMDPGKPAATMQVLTITPQQGVTGTPITIAGTGLPAGAALTLTWSSANVTWVVDPQATTVDYHGRQATPVTVSVAQVTTDASGAFSTTFKAPNDWGGLHDIYAVSSGAQLAHGGFLIKRSFTMSPKSGPVGTPITITYRGLGSSLYESGASLLYDNHYAGEMMANWTRGTAQTVIRAAGDVGNHTIQIGNAINYLYLNVPQSPLPWTQGFTGTFKITKDNGPPAASLTWPAPVAPTVSQRTTLQAVGDVLDSPVHMSLASTAAHVLSSVAVTATGLVSSAPVSLVWSTVMGNRVNCKGMCWDVVSVPLASATPTGGSVNSTITVPDGLGGWHVVQMIQNGKTVAQIPFFVKESIVGRGVSAITVKQGQHFTIHVKGIGWTQIDNVRGVNYDNSYIGYGCGFNSQGNVVFNLQATGAPGTHLIDMFPMLYTLSPSFANTPYGMVPVLSSSRDYPGLALGYQIPIAHFAITVVK